MNRPVAVILVSGGLDSCVTAAIATRNFEPAFLHLNYGQRTETRELHAFNQIADHYDVDRRLIVDVRHFAQIGGSSLTDKNVPVSKADLKSTSIPTSYVPFRNANILAIATSWAEVIGAQRIFIGAVEEDSSGYPDCRKDFFTAFEHLIARGTRPETIIRVETPLIDMSKSEIVKVGIKLKAPLESTWSCYQDEELACGECDSCALRLRGFQQAGYEDPVPYRQRLVYR